jgi:hypothetical protein
MGLFDDRVESVEQVAGVHAYTMVGAQRGSFQDHGPGAHVVGGLCRVSVIWALCCESMVVRVHSANKLVAWSATARVRPEIVSCRQLASLGSAQLRS